LESGLLGGNDTTVDDGTSTEPVDGTETTDTTTEPTDEPVDDEDPIKAIQKLTGKLSQKMRDINDKLESDDIKYILNSVISAADVNKLNDEDKTDITNKLEDKGDESGDEVNEIGAPIASFYTASGGQTIGESTKIKVEAILEQARLNVKNKLNKNINQ